MRSLSLFLYLKNSNLDGVNRPTLEDFYFL
jgi:hypothetical protein